MTIACFISSHGYGHAARSCAIMEALTDFNPEVQFEIFTETPLWFFNDSLEKTRFHYHILQTDVGLVQRSPLEEDIPLTIRKLNDFVPFSKDQIDVILPHLQTTNCRVVICDISILGIEIAARLNIPSILLENFTWDWIYEAYIDNHPQIKTFIEIFRGYYEQADYHIQTRPNCNYQSETFQCNPISRREKAGRKKIRQQLQIPEHIQSVLVSMGGVKTRYDFLDQLEKMRDIIFILPHDVPEIGYEKNLRILPHHSPFFHPDLVAAADAVIGKLGYSTLAEIYHAGKPYGFIERDFFRESKPLARFVLNEMNGIRFTSEAFIQGNWLKQVKDLLNYPIIERNEMNGSARAAEIIRKIIR